VTHRILFAFVGGRGHLDPLVPIARAALDAGHAVGMAAGPRMADAVRSTGLPWVPVDDPAPSRPDGPTATPGPEPAPELLPLLAVDRAREESDLRERFVREAAPTRAARMLALAEHWRPDAIVVDEVDVGSVVAAERLGIPCASVVVLAAGGFLRPDVVADALDEVRVANSLAPDPLLERARGGLIIDPAPPGFRDPADPLPEDRTLAVHLGAPPAAPTGPPPWPVTRPGRPAVYVTLGTIFNAESGDLFERVLAAVAEHDGDVLVTVGHDRDPAAFGEPPAHVHVERFVPQAEVLPQVAAVVSHAGSGSVLGALAHGLPMVLLPMGADQPWNGDRVEALGVGRVLDPVLATPASIADALRDTLSEPGYRERAAALATAWAARPGPAAAVEALQRRIARSSG
jgi:UDP:flavonoid glycosyltransferase YjiC (YdhE family)